MSKPYCFVMRKEPLRIGVRKNGRHVTTASALATLKKAYPDITSERWFELRRSNNCHGDHTTVFELKPEGA